MSQVAARSFRGPVALASVMALIMSVLVVAPASGAGGTGNYGQWSASGSTGTLPPISSGKLGASVTYVGSSGSISNASTAWLGAWTPFGQVWGPSRTTGPVHVEPYLSVGVPSSGGSVVTIEFTNPTPASGWGFTLGDVDSENVKVEAFDKDNNPVAVAPWFRSTFNYCNGSPAPSGVTCTGTQSEPTWDSANTSLLGGGPDTVGASGWFKPNVSVKRIVLTGTQVVGFPTYQVWIAADTTIPDPPTPPTPPTPPQPTPRPPVTLQAKNVKRPAQQVTPCTSSTRFVTLTGTTRKKAQKVTVYRAKRVGSPATRVKTVRSKNHKFKIKRVSTNRCRTPVFCAAANGKFSAPVKLRVKRNQLTSRGETGVRCRARGSR